MTEAQLGPAMAKTTKVKTITFEVENFMLMIVLLFGLCDTKTKTKSTSSREYKCRCVSFLLSDFCCVDKLASAFVCRFCSLLRDVVAAGAGSPGAAGFFVAVVAVVDTFCLMRAGALNKLCLLSVFTFG